jgi:hypothetical protein
MNRMMRMVSLLDDHDVLDDLLGQFEQHLLAAAPEVVRHLLVADALVLELGRLSHLRQERREGAALELLALEEVAEDVHDAGHAQVVVELQHLVRPQVHLQRPVDDVRRLAVRPEEVSEEVRLRDLLVESSREVLVELADLLVLPLALVVELAVTRLRTVDALGVVALGGDELGSEEVAAPVESGVLLVVVVGSEGADEVLEEDDVVLDEVEGEHEGGHESDLPLHQLDLVHYLGQEVELLHLQPQQVLLPRETILHLLHTDRRGNPQPLTAQLVRLLLQTVFHLPLRLHAALELRSVEDLRLGAGLRKELREHWVLPDL